jgi:hypothetical protein
LSRESFPPKLSSGARVNLLNTPKKAKNGKDAYYNKELWIAPSHSLKRQTRQTGWELYRVEPPESNKFLELADIALGLNKPSDAQRRRVQRK